MEFTFLGTSSGVPTLERNVSGLVIKRRNRKAWYLVDCGEGSQQQLLRLPYSLVNLVAIFITHVHGDHTYGLPGILASASMAGRKAPLLIVGPPEVESFVRAAMAHTDMYLAYELVFKPADPCIQHDMAPDFRVSVHALSHRVASHAYAFVTSPGPRRLDVDKLQAAKIPRGPLWGQLAKGIDVEFGDGRRICASEFELPADKPLKTIVGGDNDTPSLLARATKDAQVLIHEATYTQAIADKVGPGPQHSSAKQVAFFAEQVSVPNLVLTHFSARYHRPVKDAMASLSDIETEAVASFSGRLFLAEDFDHFILDSDGTLSKKVPEARKIACNDKESPQ